MSTIVCSDCSQTRKHVARGLCSTCYTRRRRAGTRAEVSRSRPMIYDCGTYAAWNAHFRDGTGPCEACETAARERWAQRRAVAS